MKVILGKKIAMSQKFKTDGQVIPVTVIKAGPCFIYQVKKSDKDGYQAIQIGLETRKKVNKPLKGHLKNLEQARYLREFRAEGDKTEFQNGQQITAAVFTAGEKVDVTATSKGKGFQGVVKRHHFAGAPKTHGDKDQLRHGGSIGAQRPQRVLKNKRMAGRMGTDQVTVKNLEIIEVDDKNNLLYVKGAVPGSRNALVKIVGEGEMKLEQIKKTEDKAEDKVEEKKEESAVAVNEVVAPEKETAPAESK
jgi:large subunit ribosomal protein L3